MERNFVRPALREWGKFVRSYNKQNHIIEFITGHVIYLISAENIRTIEGASNAAYIIIDEASLIDEGVLEAADTRAIDCRAPIFTASTAVPGPGLEWLEEQYNKGMNPQYSDADVDYYVRYASFTGTMWDNPTLSKAEIDNYIGRRSQKELAYRLYGGFPDIGEHVFDASLLKPEHCGYRLDELKEFRLEKYMFLDTASGQTQSERGDDTAIVIAGIAPEYGIFGLECIADRFSVAEIERIMIEKARQHDVRSIGIEYLATQTNYFLQSLRKSLLITDSFRIIPIKRHGGQDAKPARHGRLLPYLEQGRLRFPVDEYGNFIRGFDKMIAQMKATPYTAKTHDDCIDALADVCAPEMNIIDGVYQEFPAPPDVQVSFPLMTEDELHRIRRGEPGQHDDLAEHLREMAGIYGLN